MNNFFLLTVAFLFAAICEHTSMAGLPGRVLQQSMADINQNLTASAQRFDGVLRLQNDFQVKFDTDLYTTDYSVGGAGGGKYVFTGGNGGTYLQQLKVYRSYDRLQGMDVTLSTGKTLSIGTTQYDDTVIFDFSADEKFTRIQIKMGDYYIPTVGAIIITTNKETYSVQCINFVETHCQEIPVGSGDAVGIFAGAGWDLDSFGLAMLKTERPGP